MVHNLKDPKWSDNNKENSYLFCCNCQSYSFIFFKEEGKN